MIDNISNPLHYNSSNAKCECGRRIQCIDITRHMSFNCGNVIKYLWRSEHKNGLEDLKKAQWYLNDLIQDAEIYVSHKIKESSKRFRLIRAAKWNTHHAWPKLNGLRHLIFRSNENGLDVALRRIGEKLYIHEREFFIWAEKFQLID